MQDLANCPKCNAIFIVGVKNVCNKCYQEEAWALADVRSFLKVRRNKRATIAEIAAATQVKEELLLTFIKEKKINIDQCPNLAYPCGKCGTEIREGKLCYGCARELREELRVQGEIDLLAEKNALKG